MAEDRRPAALTLIAMAALAGCKTTDLAMSDMVVSPASVATGEEFTVVATVKNTGNTPVGSADGISAPVTVDIQLFGTAAGFAPVAYLTGWGVSSDRPFMPREEMSQSSRILASGSLAVGSYTLCADVDFKGRVTEKNEANNNACAPFTIKARDEQRADIVIDSVTTTEVEKDSQGVTVRIRNVGRSAISSQFPLMALSRETAEPMYFTTCALATADRAAGGALPCGGVWTNGTIEPGQYVELTGYVTAPLTLEAGMTTNVIGNPPARRRIVVDIIADGCRAPGETPALPSWCRVDETNELNNTGSATMLIR